MAEVKVKITAQNEVQTGLQQALNDAKKFGQEATSAVTIDEQAATAPIRKIQSALAQGVKVPSPKLESDRPLKVAVEAETPKLSDQQAVKVALEATGLEQIEQLKAALAEADNKVLRVALEASGLSTAEELREALAQAEDKTVQLALEATGLSSVEELRAALDQADSKTVQLALEATGLSSAKELTDAIDRSENKSVQLALEATGLSDAKSLKAAIDSPKDKTVRLALEATGLKGVKDLESAIDSVESKNIEIETEHEKALAPLRELQAELKKTRQAAQQALDPQPAEEFSGGIAESAGRMALLGVGAAVVGKAISAAFDQLSQALKSAIGIQEQFNQTLSQAGRATSLSGAVSEFTQLSNAAKQTGKVIADTFGRNIGESIANALQGRPGQIIARLADLATGGAVRGELEAGQEQQRRIARENAMANMARLDQESFELVGAGGDPAELARIKREQEKRRQMEELRAGSAGKSPADIEREENELRNIQAMQDQMTAQERAFAAQQRAAQTNRATAQIGMTPQERLAQEQANQTRLQGEVVGASQGAQSMAEVAARVAELNAEIAASKQIQAQLEKQIADEAERAAKASEAAQRNAMASAQAQAQANRVAGMTPQEQLDFEKRGLADLEGFVGPAVDLAREQTISRILALESQITSERERQEKASQDAVDSLENVIERRDFSALSTDEEKQASIRSAESDLIAGIESGEISPAEAAARAIELQNRQDSINDNESRFGGSDAASSLQRVGLASNEFFDASANKTTKAINDTTAIVRRIATLLEGSKGLYLERN
jgi:hypothetical protein